MKKFLFTLAFAALAAGAAAQEAKFSYDTGTRGYSSMGTNKAEVYNVAIRIGDPSLAGAKVTRARVPMFCGMDDIKEVSFWLAEELTVENSADNGPTIMSQEPEVVKIGGDYYYTVTFETPYTLTDKGIYVGYTFRVQPLNDLNGSPVALCGDEADGGLYLLTSRTYKRRWQNQYGIIAGSSAMEVFLTGVKENSATIQTDSEPLNVVKNEDIPFSFTVTNSGSAGIKDLDFSYDFNGRHTTVHHKLSTALAGQLGLKTNVEVKLPAVAEKGEYPLTLTLEKVNGTEVAAAGQTSVSTVINVFDYFPKHRAVLEEYTGTWCGYCPRGYVGLEEMDRLHPDDFIAISYHNSDPMEIMSVNSFPVTVGSFPTAHLDRVKFTDAYHGDTQANLGIEKTWLERCEVEAPANVDVEAQWDEAEENIRITAHVQFFGDYANNPYLLAYVLTADGLTGSSSDWLQSNYYAGYSYPGDIWKTFIEGGSYVRVTFNDVCIYLSGKGGLTGSLPKAVQLEEVAEHSHSVRASVLKNTSGVSLVQDKTKINAIALLINKNTGEIANAAKCRVQLKANNPFDLNGDGAVDVSDVTTLVARVLSETAGESDDLNGDGTSDVSDVTTLVGKVLSNE
ncbi:MAG: hypothetical protein IJ722_05355 [Alloprevotella sp.]|nr:hypothetical protein [Alloprevotella sp.]